MLLSKKFILLYSKCYHIVLYTCCNIIIHIRIPVRVTQIRYEYFRTILNVFLRELKLSRAKNLLELSVKVLYLRSKNNSRHN
jgi:hypothetical protein